MPGKSVLGRISSVILWVYIGSNVMPSYVFVNIFFSKGAPFKSSTHASFHSSYVGGSNSSSGTSGKLVCCSAFFKMACRSRFSS